MNKNKLLERFETKTNEELETILSEKSNYVDEAIMVAKELLESRKVLSEPLVAFQKELSKQKELEKLKEEERIKSSSSKNPIEDLEIPEFYSEKVIYGFSMFFSTIFGAVLLMYNLKQVENSRGRSQVLIFGILYTVLVFIIIQLLQLSLGFPTILLNGIGAAILNEYFWKKHIGIKTIYDSKNWGKAAIISMLITIPYVLFLIFIGELLR